MKVLHGETGVQRDQCCVRTLARSTLCAVAGALIVALSGCGSAPTRETTDPVARAPDGVSPQGRRPLRGGGYYLDDGPGDNPPANIDQIPDAVPRKEPLHRGAMRPYTVMGQNYAPMTQIVPYRARGVASWYGRRYHGQKTSSGEIYDMYGMTAAHTVLPIPSYARVTNVANNKSIVVRINDRGPFHADRLIDLSYTAAHKLGVLGGGRAVVDVETIIVDAGTPTTPTVAVEPAAPITPTPPTDTSRLTVVTPLSSSAGNVPAGTELASAAPATSVTPSAPIIALIPEQKGLFLQLAAFGSQDNADNFLLRLRTQIDWLASTLHVYNRDGLYRVHAGPYKDSVDARAAADRISDALGIKPMVITR